jgi:hypothetical protein
MNYTIRIIKDGETLAIRRAAEHPSEAQLDTWCAEYGADFCDVCRS